MAARKTIPAKTQLKVKIEAGYRCAIPTCKAAMSCEIAHIVPHSETQDHSFNNLILLCPNCHTRYDRHEISRDAIRHYKQNLFLLNNRYTDLEKRVLEIFVKNNDQKILTVHASLEILYIRLEEDGFFTVNRDLMYSIDIDGYPLGISVLELTDLGRDFIQNLRDGKSIL